MTRRDAFLIPACYLLVFLCYRFLLGLPFSSQWVPEMWQFLDLELLRTDLLSSLYNLHAQPPLMNLLLGLLLKISEPHAMLLLDMFFAAAGCLSMLALNCAAAHIGIRRSIRLSMLAWVMITPTFMLFSSWAYTTHLEFCLCAWLLAAAASQQDKPALNWRDALHLGLPLLLLMGLRAQWHLGVALAFVAFNLWGRARAASRGYLAGLAAAILPVFVLYLKNLLVFGFFGVSSWFGLTFAQVAGHSAIPLAEISALQQQGIVSPYFPPDIEPDRALLMRDYYSAHGGPVVARQHPALVRYKSNGEINYNFLPFIEAGRLSAQDAAAVIRHDPIAYVGNIVQHFVLITVTPSLAHDCCGFSLSNIGVFADTFNSLPEDVKFWLSMGGLELYLIGPLLIIALTFPAHAHWRSRRRFVLLAVWLIAVMGFTACAFNPTEQIRMRWGVAPCYLLFAAMIIEAAGVKWSRKKANGPHEGGPHKA